MTKNFCDMEGCKNEVIRHEIKIKGLLCYVRIVNADMFEKLDICRSCLLKVLSEDSKQ